MKASPLFPRLLLAACLALLPGGLRAQNNNAPPPPAAESLLNADELAELLGPIALYPDALVSIILPASTVPSDVVLGARFVANGGDPDLADKQPWDDSVRSLARYPDVLAWMNENLEWTAAVGEAFVEQPADVLNAIQHLRTLAREKGNLVDTPQQVVVQEDDAIRILPADPEVIYVPQYDPTVVYYQSYDPGYYYEPGYYPWISFGIGFSVGPWLGYDCDWHHRRVYRGEWCGWNNNGRGRDINVNVNNSVVNNNVNVVNIRNNTVNAWQPSAKSLRNVSQRQSKNIGNARFATAEARQVRATARAENRPAKVTAASALPRPNRLAVAKNEKDRNDAAARLATVREKSRENAPQRPGDASRVNPPTRPNTANVESPRPDRVPKVPSAPPKVAGQLEERTKRPENARPGADANESRPKAPNQANKNESNNNERPRQAPRVNTPTTQPRVNQPQVTQPKVTQPRVEKPRTEKPKVQNEQPAPRRETPRVPQPQNPQPQNVPRLNPAPRQEIPKEYQKRQVPQTAPRQSNASQSENRERPQAQERQPKAQPKAQPREQPKERVENARPQNTKKQSRSSDSSSDEKEDGNGRKNR